MTYYTYYSYNSISKSKSQVFAFVNTLYVKLDNQSILCYSLFMKVNWQRDILDNLYNHEGKTLQQIGEIYGVSRERVRQVMKELDVSYTRKRTRTSPYLNQHRFKDVDDYLKNHRGKSKRESSLQNYLEKLCCSLCGEVTNLHIHHLHYPARSLDDLQILCARCHRIEHVHGIDVNTRQKIHDEYASGESVKSIAKRYKVAAVTIYKVIAIVRKGQTTHRR